MMCHLEQLRYVSVLCVGVYVCVCARVRAHYTQAHCTQLLGVSVLAHDICTCICIFEYINNDNESCYLRSFTEQLFEMKTFFFILVSLQLWIIL